MSVSHEFEAGNQGAEPNVIEFPGLDPQEYWAHVQKRVSHKDPETTSTGATIYSELVTFNDSLGNNVVRELTIAEPNSNLVAVSPYPWVETDPWTTGSEGFNKDKIKQYADLGFTVLWLHHGGRYSPVAKDKSTSRSAHQMHTLLDNLKGTIDTNVDEVLLGGYSRGAMTAEKFIVSADNYRRAVLFSDTEAPCFVKDMTVGQKIEAVIRQVPSEAIGIGKIALRLLRRSIDEEDPTLIVEYAKTLDFHYRNMLNEAMWAKALINASVGHAIAALPEDTIGVRTFFADDIMSQQSHYEELYAAVPGIQVVTEEGPHVAGAFTENLDKKYDRMQRLMNYMQDHSMSLLGVLPEHVLPALDEKPTPRRHLRSVKIS